MCLEYLVVIGFLLLPLLLGPCAEEERDENWRRRSMRESYWRVEGGGGGGRTGNFVRSTFIRKFACVVGCFGKGGPFRVAGCFGKGGLFVKIVASIVCSQTRGGRNVSDYTD